MFKNIKTDSDREEVLELLTYAVLDHPERGEAALRTYQTSDDWKLFGVEDEGLVVGIVGFEEQEDETIVIRHLVPCCLKTVIEDMPEVCCLRSYRSVIRNGLLWTPMRKGQIFFATWALLYTDRRTCPRMGNFIVCMKWTKNKRISGSCVSFFT